ncbi:diguanylate cyclase [Sutcliffiella cohnii]|uniref:diguanylate cyclase n=1 Tax=Sutcliffiella cohnii TaxID=33932 RepID=UPI002E1E1C88|nr:diguanylate cyclase [Sutcliffiella cohnii]MED4015620.1 diguanylate cyclase [Sutcliffiella cohnii]
MHEAVQSVLSNIAIIFIMHLLINLIIVNRKEYLNKILFSIALILTTSIAVIILFYLPIVYGDFQFDMRFIPLVFLAYKWGWKHAIPALVIVSLWRLGMGGQGAVPGVIFGMMFPTFISLFMKWLKQTELKSLTLLIIITLSWLASDIPIIFFVPNGLQVFAEMSMYRLLTFLITAFALHFFIVNAEKELYLRERLTFYAEHDPLTGLNNIRHFEEKVKAYKTKQNKNQYIIMLDIDHFKSVNDEYGHLSGDMILKGFADIMLKKVSSYHKDDVFSGRYGGEEFIIFFATDSKEELIHFADSFRQEIEDTEFRTESKAIKKITVSLGISMFSESKSLYDTISEADEALYKSKRNGRNQVQYFAD